MKRSPLKARKPLAAVSKRKKTCVVCKQKFIKTRTFQPTCSSVECSMEYIKRQQVAKAAAPYITKPRKPSVRSNERSHQLELTQRAFNAWIRWRDRDQPCISSGRYKAAQWDAGHYRPVGGQGGSILRFDEMNCHKQNSEQNQHQSGALSSYRPRLIKRIGLADVERLEATRGTKKWDIDELKVIRAKYRKRLRDEQRQAEMISDA